jgi:hypothetical protein
MGQMNVHVGSMRDNKWHPYTICMISPLIVTIATFDANGVGVPFIIPYANSARCPHINPARCL